MLYQSRTQLPASTSPAGLPIDLELLLSDGDVSFYRPNVRLLAAPDCDKVAQVFCTAIGYLPSTLAQA